VTGVQTCALPILLKVRAVIGGDSIHAWCYVLIHWVVVVMMSGYVGVCVVSVRVEPLVFSVLCCVCGGCGA